MTERWFAVMAKPQREATAHQHLKRQGFFSFYPHYPKKKRPYLRGYLFVRSPAFLIGPVYHTIGVHRVVGMADRPWPIPDKFMDELFKLTRHDKDRVGEIIDAPNDEDPFSQGVIIRVKDGHTAWGLLGVVRQVCPKHVVVEMEIALMGQREMSLRREDIELAP